MQKCRKTSVTNSVKAKESQMQQNFPRTLFAMVMTFSALSWRVQLNLCQVCKFTQVWSPSKIFYYYVFPKLSLNTRVACNFYMFFIFVMVC